MFVETNTIEALLPEIILVALATWTFVAGAFAPGRRWWTMLALCVYLVAAYALFQDGAALRNAFDMSGYYALAPRGPIAVDLLSFLLRGLALGVGFVSTLMVSHLLREKVACELLGLIMLAVAGVMLASGASELVLLFLGLELVSIPTYILLYIGRPGRAGAEATAKYFYLSILSSAMLLYGFSFLYGMAGTTAMFGDGGIREQLAQRIAEGSPLMYLAPLALVLIFAGLGFKMAAVPFHFYVPDVYQGTTNVNAGLLAVLPKIAGAAALIRLGVVVLPLEVADQAWPFVLIIAVLTMTIGNVCALWQTNLRRMMGYSSIAHAGYMLIGLTVALALQGRQDESVPVTITTGGVAALVFYLIVYACATLGTFAVLAHLSSEAREIDTVDELAGLNKARPIPAALLAIFMFSLAGIPPLAGFWGKLTLFSSAVSLALKSDERVSLWLLALAVVGALNAAIAAAYYLRLVGAMYFRSAATEHAQPGGSGSLAAAVVCGVLVVLLGVSPNFVLTGTRQAESSAMQMPDSTLTPSAREPVAYSPKRQRGVLITGGDLPAGD